jgi:hypothetical protein
MSGGWLGTAGARIGRAVGVRLEDGDIAVAEGVERMALAMLHIRAASGLTDDATDMEVALSVGRLCHATRLSRPLLAELRFVTDGPPGPEGGGRFVEVENERSRADFDLRDLRESHELALAELSRTIADLEAEKQANERLRTGLARVATHLMGGPPVRESVDDVCALAESRAALRRALVAELSPDGRLSDRELLDLLRERLRASVAPAVDELDATIRELWTVREAFEAATRRADAAEARLRLVGDAVAALVEVARG